MDEAATAWTIDVPGLTVVERPVAVCVLRVRQPDPAAAALAGAFGAAWPSTPNTITDAAPQVAWLAPGEWAIFAPAAALEARVADACAGLTHHLAEVSAGRRLWRVAGDEARALIAKGCSLDTDPSLFPAGRCAQTLLAQVGVLLIPQAGEGQAFDILADASFAGHLRAWFADAALEFRP